MPAIEEEENMFDICMLMAFVKQAFFDFDRHSMKKKHFPFLRDYFASPGRRK